MDPSPLALDAAHDAPAAGAGGHGPVPRPTRDPGAREQPDPEHDAPATSPSVHEPVPYPGLRPYARDEKDWFYGRQEDARVIGDKILAARLTLLYAPSGAGKSSVLNAG